MESLYLCHHNQNLWRTNKCQRSKGVTSGVVEDPLDQDRVLCDSLCYQQDAFLDTMTTQQRTTADTLRDARDTTSAPKPDLMLREPDLNQV